MTIKRKLNEYLLKATDYVCDAFGAIKVEFNNYAGRLVPATKFWWENVFKGREELPDEAKRIIEQKRLEAQAREERWLRLVTRVKKIRRGKIKELKKQIEKLEEEKKNLETLVEIEDGREKRALTELSRRLGRREYELEELRGGIKRITPEYLNTVIPKAQRLAGNKPYFEIGFFVEGNKMDMLYYNSIAFNALTSAGYGLEQLSQFLYVNSDILMSSADKLEDKYTESIELKLSLGDDNKTFRMSLIGDKDFVFSVPLTSYCYRLESREIKRKSKSRQE